VAEELAQIKKTSIDYYAAIRSMYRQKRSADIRNGEDSEMPPIPDINYELSTTPSQ
jgi:phospholipid-binding lipoprotein MlaA